MRPESILPEVAFLIFTLGRALDRIQLIVQTIRSDSLALASDATEQRAFGELGELDLVSSAATGQVVGATVRIPSTRRMVDGAMYYRLSHGRNESNQQVGDDDGNNGGDDRAG